MACSDDFALDYVNKVAHHASGTTVYPVQTFYSWIMDEVDELGAMDDEVPMSAQTPTSYTMINGWYLQELATQFLNGGAIQTSGYDDEIRTLLCSSAGWTNFDSDDYGTLLTAATTGDTGTVLDYDNTYYKVFVRMVDTDDLFDDSDDTYTAVGGAGAGTAINPATTGETIFANPYTLGTLNGDPDLYIFQNDGLIAQFWDSDHFDILIKVKETGVDIDGKVIWVADHTWGSLYDSFQITLTTAGQNAVPLGTGVDLNSPASDITSDISAYVDGTTASIAYDFNIATPFTYDIGDGNGTQDYEVEIDADGQRLSVVYKVMKHWNRAGSTDIFFVNDTDTPTEGQAYRYVDSDYPESKQSPLGTFAGGKMFGARSVYFTNLHADDAQAFQLIDKGGTNRFPPNYQSFVVTGLTIGDRAAIFLANSDDDSVIKNQYTLDAPTVSEELTVTVSIPSDTPTTGTIIVVDTDFTETVYTYSAFSTDTFTASDVSSDNHSSDSTAYVPYVYETATAGTVSESVVYGVNRYVVARVRKTGIIPFQTAGTFGATGYSAAAIRNPDTIYSSD